MQLCLLLVSVVLSVCTTCPGGFPWIEWNMRISAREGFVIWAGSQDFLFMVFHNISCDLCFLHLYYFSIETLVSIPLPHTPVLHLPYHRWRLSRCSDPHRFALWPKINLRSTLRSWSPWWWGSHHVSQYPAALPSPEPLICPPSGTIWPSGH